MANAGLRVAPDKSSDGAPHHFLITALPVMEADRVRAVFLYLHEFVDHEGRVPYLDEAFAEEPATAIDVAAVAASRPAATRSEPGAAPASGTTPAPGAGPASASDPTPALDPTSGFLLDTLIARQVIRRRNDVSYLTLRAWRKPIRDSQIKALRHLKADPPRAFVSAAAQEVAAAAQAAFGAAAFGSVVPVPCGHSRRDDCFSVRLAQAAADYLGTACIEVFACAPREGTSHPRRSAALPKLRRIAEPVYPVLVVDDVASSGRHIEQVAGDLGVSRQGVFKIAWIGGDGA